MVKIMIHLTNNGRFLTENEKELIKQSFFNIIKEFGLFDKIKSIAVTYDSNDVLSKDNRAYINIDENQLCHKNREYEFCTSFQYIFNNGHVNSNLIRHELMHLKDVFGEYFEYNLELEKKFIKNRGCGNTFNLSGICILTVG